jgi:uncharacterized protein YjbJ (UPF0337 family)
MSLDSTEGAAKQGVGKIKETAGSVLGDTGMQAKGKLDEAMGSVQQTYGRVSETARDALSQAADRARSARGELQTLIDEQPVLVAAVALGLGLAIGLLLLGGTRMASDRR